ncbi:methyltransferase family protein [Pseudonocardia sp.]|uniref:methyltransferase family protein n=1 Tax=Pseudonocardia sp. TaxID=60912 RepID=UPI003BEF29F6
MGQADVAALRRLAGLATPMTLRVAVTLGLPDRLRDGAATATELAARQLVAGALRPRRPHQPRPRPQDLVV